MSPSFQRLTRATRTGNPDRVVCYNPWVLPRVTDFQDTPIPPPAVDKETFVRDMESATGRGIVQDATMSPQSLVWMRAVRAAVRGK